MGILFRKRLQSVPNLLKELGMEDTNANERAVRILGYNGMEITEENVLSVKEYDTVLNRVIDNMKPSTVLEMIRQGDNPLDTSINELDSKLTAINASKDLSSEENTVNIFGSFRNQVTYLSRKEKVILAFTDF